MTVRCRPALWCLAFASLAVSACRDEATPVASDTSGILASVETIVGDTNAFVEIGDLHFCCATYARNTRRVAISNLPVAATVIAGGGTVRGMAVTSTPDDGAPVAWVLGRTPGRQVLRLQVGAFPPVDVIRQSVEAETTSIDGVFRVTRVLGDALPRGMAMDDAVNGSRFASAELTLSGDRFRLLILRQRAGAGTITDTTEIGGGRADDAQDRRGRFALMPDGTPSDAMTIFIATNGQLQLVREAPTPPLPRTALAEFGRAR